MRKYKAKEDVYGDYDKVLDDQTLPDNVKGKTHYDGCYQQKGKYRQLDGIWYENDTVLLFSEGKIYNEMTLTNSANENYVFLIPNNNDYSSRICYGVYNQNGVNDFDEKFEIN